LACRSCDSSPLPLKVHTRAMVMRGINHFQRLFTCGDSANRQALSRLPTAAARSLEQAGRRRSICVHGFHTQHSQGFVE
jgi:hypothetical protein